MATSLASAPALARPHAGHVQRLRRNLAAGAATTVYVARYPAAGVSVRLVVLRRPQPLAAWCSAAGVGEAIVGGFFTRRAASRWASCA